MKHMKTKMSLVALALAWTLVSVPSCGGAGNGGIFEECGNGTVEAMEECDDGGLLPCDGCSPTCTSETGYICGDGVSNQTCGEQCDDGNTVPGDGCDATCLLEGCGNGVLEAGEECDDGNTIPGDGCDAACLLEGCGNGVLDAGEECDDGGLLPCDGCSPTCTNETGYVCGDGIPNQTCGEQCDDGNTTPGDGCDATCQIEPGPLDINGDYAIDIDTTFDGCDFGSKSVSSPMNVLGRTETQFTVAIPVGGAGDDCNRLEFMRTGNVLTRTGSAPGAIGPCAVQIDVATTLEFFADDTLTGFETTQVSATGGDCSGFALPCAVELAVTGLRCTGCFDCVEGAAGQGAKRQGLLGTAFSDVLDAIPERRQLID